MNKITILLFLLLVVLLSCKRSGRSDDDENPALAVDGILVEQSEFLSSVTTTGNLLPYEDVELKSPIAGNVLAIYFKEGQVVNKGERLIQIDDREWKARQKGILAQLASSETELERRKALIDIQGTTQEEIDRLEATVQNLQAQVEELQVSISLARVSAPFAGEVGMRDFSLGAYLSEGQTITRLVQVDRLKVDFNLPARYAGEVREGHEVQVIVASARDTLQATVYAINPVVNRATRNVQVRALLENRSNAFIPGDFVEVIVALEQSDSAFLVPTEAVVPELNAHIVYKVQNGRANKQEVSLGTRTASRVQILSGIEEGDTVLVTGLLQVSDGAEVEVRELKKQSL